MESISDRVYELVQAWRPLDQDTVGKQLIRAADSIGANIAESFGRYHYAEKLNFLYYARGSIYEVKFRFRRAQNRNLLAVDICQRALSALDDLTRKLNAFISNLRRRRYAAGSSGRVAESPSAYATSDTELEYYPADETESTNKRINQYPF